MMLGRICYCSLIFVLLMVTGSLYAATDILILTDKTNIHIASQAELFEDKTGKLTIAEVSEGGYDFRRRAEDETDYLGFTQSAFWLRINLLNHSQETHWYINVWGGLSRKYEAYIRSGKNNQFKPMDILERSIGRVYSFESRENVVHTLYFRVQDLQLPLDIALSLNSSTYMLSQAYYYVPIYSFMVGGLLILSLYNFLYFVYLRDKGFLALSVFIVAFLIEMGGHMGLWHYFQSVNRVLSSLGGLFAFLTIASAISLVMNLLEYKRYLPLMYRQSKVLIWFCLGLAFISPFVRYSSSIAALLSIVLILMVFFSIRLLVLTEFKFPFSIIVAGFIFLLGIAPSLLMAVGIIELNGVITDLSPLALLLALLLISFTQAEKVRDKSEKAERTLASNQVKDEFLTTMSHELRTPMHAVVGAGRLLRLTQLSEDQSELVSRLNSSSKHMLSLINDILDLSRVENNSVMLEKIPFKLSELQNSLEALLSESAQEKNLKLTLVNHFTPLNLDILGDVTRLRQILLNLLSNAIKFTSRGSVSFIVTPVSVQKNQVTLRFEVVDTGIGISDKHQHNLFRPFTQAESSTSRKYGGSGLGLAISHKLVGCMGGELKLISQTGKGSRFFFTLDLDLQKSSRLSENKKDPSVNQRLEGLKVLLVDDDEMNRFFGEKLLKVCGVDAIVAESGQQAIDYLQQQSIDLVFMDVSMPEMNGYETTAIIRRHPQFEHLTIIALTAHAIAGERERCLAAGMSDFLTKPFELDALKSMLNKWLSESPVTLSKRV